MAEKAKKKAGTKTVQKQVTVAFIGCGIQAKSVLIPNFIKQKNVVVKAVCDCDKVRREYAAQFVNDYYTENKKAKLAKCQTVADFRDILADPEIDAVFAASPLPISVKTRLGMEDPGEFPAILEIYNRYPIKELTIHPRVRKQFYDGDVSKEMFRYATENSRNPLCFNGDIRSKAEADAVAGVEAVMIGRALVGDPGMLLAGGTDVKTLEAFHNELLDTYTEAFGGGRNAMFRLKENWHMLIGHFEGSEKLWKRLRKTTDLAEFKAITAEIFHALQFR